MAAIRRLGSATARSVAGLLPHHRAFGAAAVAEVDYWTDWAAEEEKQGRGGPAFAADEAACGERETRGVQWVFMGRPGSAQRHVYATSVAQLLDVPYISMGSLVRQELNPNSYLYKKIADAVNEGRLVPEEIIFGLLSKRLEEGYQIGETGFVLDGIPRTTIQAEILDQIADIDLVVNLKCEDDCLVKKHFGDHVCSHCGKGFDASNSGSANFSPCLATRTCHAELRHSPAVVMKDIHMEKFRVYSEQFKLLEEYYRKQKKLLDVQVADGPIETWQGLLAALHMQHMDTTRCSNFRRIN